MSDIIDIAERAAAVRGQWRHADIWEILDRLKVPYQTVPLGTARSGLKGYCTSFFDQFAIGVNSELPDYLQRLIAWHELGHIILDPDLLRNGRYITEQDPLNMRTHTELRANYFAAEAAIDDGELLDLLHQGRSLAEAAAQLLVPESLVIYKSEILRAYGEALPMLDAPDALFLGGDITGKENF